MTDLDTTAEGHRALDPDEVSSRTFPTAFRGFDPVQVRAFLGDVADELRRLRDQEAALRRAIAEPSAPTADATSEAGAEADAADPTDEVASAAAVVEEAKAEADRLLREARERVEQLGAAATAETTRVLEEARAEAARLRATATDDLKGRFEEAEATAVRKIAEAEREAASIRVTAREEADATIEAARDRGREMVAEAQAARERMLADLAKRKRAAQAQLEQLRAGRDRLLDTLKVARRSIDEMTTRFDVNEAGAGATKPPASGVPSGPVTTTPGAAASDARPRAAVAAPSSASAAAAAPGPDRPRPVRARAVAIGEAPQPASRPQPSPQPAPRAQIAAPQAQVPDAPAVQPAPAEPPSSVGSDPGAASPSPAPPEPAPRAEERRSSALRILRRNKATEAPPPPPPLIGRDSPSEGVRIIGRPAVPAPPAPEGHDVVADASEPEPEVAALAAVEAPPVAHADAEPPAPDPGIDDSPIADHVDDRVVDPAEAAEAEGATKTIAAAEPEPEPEATPEPAAAGDPGPVEPLAVEEIRPRIEDLFARIRADRENATATARQVLAAADDDAPAPAASADAADDAGPTAEALDHREPTATTDADEHRLQARDVVIEPLIGQLTKRLKRALQDEQNATLDRLRTSRRPAQVDQVLSRPDDQALPYRHLALPFLDAAARGGAAASPHGPVAVAADDLAAQLAEDLAGAIRSRLDAALQAAASDDLDLGSLSERLSAVYREWKVQKVERLATHYLVAAHERGAFLAHPEGTPLRWLVDDDGPCPDCDDNALAGPTPRGEAFPTGQLHPPAHLGCRCLLTASPA